MYIKDRPGMLWIFSVGQLKHFRGDCNSVLPVFPTHFCICQGPFKQAPFDHSWSHVSWGVSKQSATQASTQVTGRLGKYIQYEFNCNFKS